jgi:F420H(2)-dependent quinone reductase
VADSRPFLPPRWFIRAAWAVHRAIYRFTGGRRGLRPPTTKTYGTLRLHTIGRRTGERRTAILGYFEDGPNLFTLAMNGWGEPEPAWWLNLQARPEATIDLPDGPRDVTARAASGEERERLWSRMRQLEPNLDGYAKRRARGTAVVVFEPRTADNRNGDPT